MPCGWVCENRPKTRSQFFQELRAGGRVVGATALARFCSGAVALFATFAGGRPKVILHIRGGLAEIVATANRLRQRAASEPVTELSGKFADFFKMPLQGFGSSGFLWIDMGDEPSCALRNKIGWLGQLRGSER